MVSFLELSVRSAIDNVQHLGDVSGVSRGLLERILPHCNAEQLDHIETSTKDTDLSPITDELWRKCYARQFGDDAVTMVEERMLSSGKKIKWRRLYHAKVYEQEDLQKQGVNRLKDLYKEQKSQKESRKCKVIDMKPPESKRMKRTGGTGGARGSSSVSKAVGKGRLMKKSRVDFVRSNAMLGIAMAERKRLNNGINQRPEGTSQR